MAMTFGGVVMLFRQCQPFNRLRAVTFSISAVVCIAVFCIPALATILYTDWRSIEFSLTSILLLICVTETAFPVSGLLQKLFGLIEQALDKTYPPFNMHFLRKNEEEPAPSSEEN